MNLFHYRRLNVNVNGFNLCCTGRKHIFGISASNIQFISLSCNCFHLVFCEKSDIAHWRKDEQCKASDGELAFRRKSRSCNCHLHYTAVQLQSSGKWNEISTSPLYCIHTLPRGGMYLGCTSLTTKRFPEGHLEGWWKSWGRRGCTTQFIPIRGSVRPFSHH